MANKLDNIDIGNPLRPEPRLRRRQNELATAAGTFWQNIYGSPLDWQISGYMKAPTLAVVRSLLNLKHGLPVLLDLNDRWAGFIHWGRVGEISLRKQRASTLVYYDILFHQIPAIGTTYLQTPEMWLHDLDYRVSHRMFDPGIGSFNQSVSSDRLDWTWEYFLDNDKVSIQTGILEFQVGDDIDKLKIWGWKLDGTHDWSLIGDWNGADAWAASKTFTDDGAISHVLKLDEGVRGEVIAGIGTISQMLGLTRRCLLSVTLMQAHTDNDYSTDHSLDQIHLKVTAEHNARETLRPNPVLTYVDGSFPPGRA